MQVQTIPTISTQPPPRSGETRQRFAGRAAGQAPGPRVKLRVLGGAGAGAREAQLEFRAADSLAHVLREAKRRGFPAPPINVAQHGTPVLQGTTSFQIIDALGKVLPLSLQIVDLDEAHARAKVKAAKMAAAAARHGETTLIGGQRRRSETTMITRTGNLEERRPGEMDNGPRVSSHMQDATVRMVGGYNPMDTNEADIDQLVGLGGLGDIDVSNLSEDMLDLVNAPGYIPTREFGPEAKPAGPDAPSNRLSERSDVSGKLDVFGKNSYLRKSGERGSSMRSSGSDMVMFSQSAMARINGLAEIMKDHPEAFKNAKVKKPNANRPPLAYTVVCTADKPGGGQILMEAQPVPLDDDHGTPMYQCGYCQSIKTSSSAGADGRVRIRCECGGKHQDGKSRMHANWNPVASRPGAPIPALGNARLMAKGPKMAANRNTLQIAHIPQPPQPL